MTKRGIRWPIGVAVVGFWIAMVGLLVHRELGAPRLAAGTAGRPADGSAVSDTRMIVRLASGELAGEVRLARGPATRDGVPGTEMTFEAEMGLRLLGKDTDLDLDGTVWRPEELPRAEIDFRIRSAEHDFRLTGEVAEGELRARVLTAGETFPLTVPVDGELLFAGGFGATLELPRLEVGEEVRVDSFDPLTLSKSTARVRCLARETLDLLEGPVRTRRLEVVTGGLTTRAWVDEAGDVVRAETPVGLVLERIPATAGPLPDPAAGGDGLGELLDRTAIRPRGERPFRTAREMIVELSGPGELDLPTDDVQSHLGGRRYRVAVPPSPGAGGGELAPVDPAHLAADPFVQSDHPKIRLRAAEIVGDEADPWRRALAIHGWVHGRLAKEPVVSIPSALEVLEQERGDCNEHTVLFTALARAAGVPTRIAIGVVWSDELGGFYYHAWPEVRVGDRWLWLDPTLGQPLADATHLKLLNGGIERWPQLLPYLGQLQVEVLSIE